MVKPFEYLGKLFVFSLILILLYIKRKVKFQLFESFDNNTGELYNNEKVSLIMNKECINHLKYYFEIKFDKLNSDIGFLIETKDKTQFFLVITVSEY